MRAARRSLPSATLPPSVLRGNERRHQLPFQIQVRPKSCGVTVPFSQTPNCRRGGENPPPGQFDDKAQPWAWGTCKKQHLKTTPSNAEDLEFGPIVPGRKPPKRKRPPTLGGAGCVLIADVTLSSFRKRTKAEAQTSETFHLGLPFGICLRNPKPNTSPPAVLFLHASTPRLPKRSPNADSKRLL